MSFSHLMSPGKIGTLELRNRIIMTPMGTNLAEIDGHCGEPIQAYYEARAKGGAAMVIVGVAAIAWPVGACNPNQVAISNDDFIPGLAALAARVKSHGCRAAIQLQHAGKVAVRDMAAGREMLVPSIPASEQDDMMSALTTEEMEAFVKSFSSDGARIAYKVATQKDINWLIVCFVDAAQRAQRAGFDGVEIHAGHGYIISEFLSPHVNKREDKYGGSLENRARLMVEIISAIKAVVGKDFPVWLRLDSKEYRVDDGICVEDAIQTVQLAEQAGADAVHMSAYANPASGIGFTEAPLVHEPGAYLKFAAAAKLVCNIPVIAVGRIEPVLADQVIAAGEADFIAMGRKLLADPELPNKIMQGRVEDIRPCIYCYTCVSQIFINESVICAVNATTGHEAEVIVSPASTPQHILVVGGGPAGMEAARVAAQRGHRVTLCESSHRLGGTVFFSSLVYEENGELIDYLEKQIVDLGVDIQLRTTVDLALVRSINADIVVLATGARREAPAIPGAQLAHVLSGDELRHIMTAEGGEVATRKLSLNGRVMLFFGALLGITRNAAALRHFSRWWMPLGKKVTIVGGGLVGVELAEFLVERGRLVTIVEEGDKFGAELAVVRRWRVLHTLREHGVTMINNSVVNKIDRTCLEISSADVVQRIDADSVILATGATANRDLANILEGEGVAVREAGDCTGVGYIEGAIRTGYHVGLSL